MRALITAFASLTAFFIMNPASAQQRGIYDVTYVGPGGSNAGSCGPTNPCATSGGALSKVRPGGRVVCLAGTDFNSLYIDRSVSIDCENTSFNVGLTGDATIIIDVAVAADDPNRTVSIRGLRLQGYRNRASVGFVGAGMVIIRATSVSLNDVSVEEFSNYGIRDMRTGGGTKLILNNVVVQNNSGPGIIAGAQGVAATVLDNVRLLNNTYGIATANGNNVVIARSTISGNTTAGVEADGGAQVNVSNSTLSHNTTNVQAFGRIRLKDNDIQFSNTAIQGSAISMGGNRFSGNVSIGTAPTLATGAPADVFN